ncbi:MAG: biopolymer transporter ExbD [Acidobacteria bacterium]|nr:biopolymer transporter ExbD [Acidobacteriota bacterium]
MDFSTPNDGAPVRWRVSYLTRLAAVIGFTLPLIGGAASSFLLMRAFQAMRNSQTAGLAAVTAAVKEAALPVTVSLYLAAAVVFLVIVWLIVRMIVETRTASPPLWFFALGGLLCLVPAGIFWRAEWLTVQAISPGGAVGAGGVAAVGAQIANLLIVSIISAPVVFLVLVAAGAVPFSRRSKSGWGALAGAAGGGLVLVAAAVAAPLLIGEPTRKQELVRLPENLKSADSDADLQKETSAILILAADGKYYLERKKSSPDDTAPTETPVSKEELPGRLKMLIQDKPPDKRIVYLKADADASADAVLKLFQTIRDVDVDKVGLVVYGPTTPNDPSQLYPKRFEVKLPEKPDPAATPPKPNPNTLIAFLKPDGKLALNQDGMGTISDPGKLTAKLAEIFKYRENNGIFREGTNEIEKTVFLKPAGECKYGDFVKLVEAVRTAGAEPIGIQFDDLPEVKVVL